MTFYKTYRKVLFTLILLISQYAPSFSQVRSEINLNGYWQFKKGAYDPSLSQTTSTIWDTVSLPHTWNDTDVNDDIPGYYRGVSWYKKIININNNYKNKNLFLYFEGANQETEIYVNGKKAGQHTGGYTRFCIQIDKLVNFEKGAINEIAVKVDNKFNDAIPPLTADFTFNGGIYRDVYLLATNPVHFDLRDASTGIYITTPEVSAKNASVKVVGKLIKPLNLSGKLQVVTTIVNNADQKIAERKTTINGVSTDIIQFTQDIPAVTNPHLWSPEDPYLYTVITRVINPKTGEIMDEVSNPLGFRWFKFDPEKGFFLNDQHIKLIGTSRHQDFKGLGNALADSYHASDLKLLKDMGGNFLRVSHYPQDPTVLEMCDKLGILASVEIPIVNAITETDAFTQNCKTMQVEMIHQNFNHPSLIIWAYMNEVLLRPKFENDKPRQQTYFANIKNLAQELEDLTRKEDPTRYTMLAAHGDFERYKHVGLIQIPMLLGWNLYQGWYGGKLDGFADFLDKHHKELPLIPLLITEYGADADPRIRSLQPEKFDKSIEYALNFHRIYLKAMQDRPFVAAAMVWNLADFNSETREETMPHINNKGLVAQDRTPKDLYRFYQANLLHSPFIKISDWENRVGLADSLNLTTSSQPLEVFSNALQVQLIVNGTSLGEKPVKEGSAIWTVPFINGTNRIEAVSGINSTSYRDIKNIRFDLIPANLKAPNLNDINILLGAKRFYTDVNTKTLWITGREYKPGSFGYIGGKPYALPGNTRQSYGTDRNIKKTENDPIYQTQQVGIQKYRLDVSAGHYELTLHFAELTNEDKKEALAYNLDNSVKTDKAQQRVFDVLINGTIVLENFDAAKRYGPLTAGIEKFKVLITNDKGLEIAFKATKGEPILNAIQLRKIY